MDTIVRDCIICELEGDCIEGVCSNCAANREEVSKMAKKCRHKKGIILASAQEVRFVPDQEPFEAGVIESCGSEEIVVESINIHYCPKCKTAEIEIDGEIWA